jgi:hypothetical protein
VIKKQRRSKEMDRRKKKTFVAKAGLEIQGAAKHPLRQVLYHFVLHEGRVRGNAMPIDK